MDRWLALLSPATAVVGFLLTWGVVALLRFKGGEIARAEIDRQLARWRAYATDADVQLARLLREKEALAGEMQSGLREIERLENDAMNLVRDLRAEREFCRRCAALLRQHGLPVPARE